MVVSRSREGAAHGPKDAHQALRDRIRGQINAFIDGRLPLKPSIDVRPSHEVVEEVTSCRRRHARTLATLAPRLTWQFPTNPQAARVVRRALGTARPVPPLRPAPPRPLRTNLEDRMSRADTVPCTGAGQPLDGPATEDPLATDSSSLGLSELLTVQQEVEALFTAVEAASQEAMLPEVAAPVGEELFLAKCAARLAQRRLEEALAAAQELAGLAEGRREALVRAEEDVR